MFLRARVVTAFARKTGDLAVLSSADIRVLALCLTLELEENGTWRVREFPGQVLIPPPKDDKAVATEGDKGKEKEVEDPAAEAQEGEQQKGDEEQLANKVASLKVDAEEEKAEGPNGVAEESAAETLPPPVPAAPTDGSDVPVSEPVASTSAAADEAQDGRNGEEEEEAHNDDDDVSDAESDSSAGSWITPDNVHAHKVRDLGLFEAPEASTSAAVSASASTSPTAGATTTTAGNTAKAAKTPKPKTIMKAAVLTGDYAMQNVALQMGLNVLGSGGKRVREVRTWVLRCHACFK